LINDPSQYTTNGAIEIQSDLVQRYIKFYDMISQFGLGIVIFPCLVASMNGYASVKYVKHDQVDMNTLNETIQR